MDTCDKCVRFLFQDKYVTTHIGPEEEFPVPSVAGQREPVSMFATGIDLTAFALILAPDGSMCQDDRPRPGFSKQLYPIFYLPEAKYNAFIAKEESLGGRVVVMHMKCMIRIQFGQFSVHVLL